MAKADAATPAPKRAYDIYAKVTIAGSENFGWSLLSSAQGRNHKDALRTYLATPDALAYDAYLVVTASASQELAASTRQTTVIVSV